MTKRKTLPKFSNEAAERRFWRTHDSTEYLDWSKAQRAFPQSQVLDAGDLTAAAPAHAGKDQGRSEPARRALPVPHQDMAGRKAEGLAWIGLFGTVLFVAWGF